MIAAAHGGSFMDAAKRTLSGIGDSLITGGINGAVGSFLGAPGTPFGGVAGSLFGGSSAGGFGSYGPQLPGSGIGDFLSHILGPFFGGAHAGGRISGPGTGTSDSMMAAVSNGEFVVKAAAARQYSGLLDRINDMTLPRYADGGSVEMASAPTIAMPAGPRIGAAEGEGGSGGIGGHNFNITLGDLHVHPASGDQFSASQFRAMAQMHADTQSKSAIESLDQVSRNLPQIQSDRRQY